MLQISDQFDRNDIWRLIYVQSFVVGNLIHIDKMTQKNRYEKIFCRVCAMHIIMTTRIILTPWRHCHEHDKSNKAPSIFAHFWTKNVKKNGKIKQKATTKDLDMVWKTTYKQTLNVFSKAKEVDIILRNLARMCGMY